MAIIIREADLGADRKLLLDILLRNRDHGDNELRKERFEWSYFKNPYGVPKAWLAIDQASSRRGAIGMVAAFPRQIKVNGSVVQGWIGGDTSIDQEFRTLGVAIKLRKAVKSWVDEQKIPFIYSYPVDRMKVVLEKVGHQVVAQFIRHGAILRTEAIFQKIKASPHARRFLAGVTNFLPPVQWSYRSVDQNYSVRLQKENRFGEEYDTLYHRANKNFQILTVRDSRFLDWRFRQNPLTKGLRIFRLEKENELQGYAIIDIQRTAARILDILIDGDRRAIRTMLLGLIRWLRANRIYTLALRATASSPILAEAKPLGFLFKDNVNAGVAVYASDAKLSATVLSEKNWFMTQADRDV